MDFWICHCGPLMSADHYHLSMPHNTAQGLPQQNQGDLRAPGVEGQISGVLSLPEQEANGFPSPEAWLWLQAKAKEGFTNLNHSTAVSHITHTDTRHRVHSQRHVTEDECWLHLRLACKVTHHLRFWNKKKQNHIYRSILSRTECMSISGQWSSA